jgi:PAS domain S-box-containing protein
MKTHDAELQRIKDLLRDNPKGIKIIRIASTFGMNRNAAAKYLEILLMTGQVEQLEHGMSKIFIMSRRTSIPTMLDRSDDFIIILDREMKISRVNDNYLEFSGMNREALLGKRADLSGIPVIGKQQLADKIREAHYGTDIRTEISEVIRDRELIFDVRLTLTVFNDGTRGITIIMSDVTREKQKFESVTDESRKLVEGIISCIDDAVILIDARTAAVSFANPAAMKMFGYAAGECLGKNSGLLLGIEGAIPHFPGNLQNAFTGQGHYEVNSRMRRNDGGEFPVHLHLRPIYNARGEIINIVMVIRDLTRPSIAGPENLPSNAWDRLVLPVPGLSGAGSDRVRPVV